MVRAFHTVVLDISSEMLISEGSALQGMFQMVSHEDGSDPTRSIGSSQRNSSAWKTRAQLAGMVWLDEEFWESRSGAADPQLVFRVFPCDLSGGSTRVSRSQKATGDIVLG